MKPVFIDDITRLLEHLSILEGLNTNGLEIRYKVDEKNFKALDEELFYGMNKDADPITFKPSRQLEIEVKGLVLTVVK